MTFSLEAAAPVWESDADANTSMSLNQLDDTVMRTHVLAPVSKPPGRAGR